MSTYAAILVLRFQFLALPLLLLVPLCLKIPQRVLSLSSFVCFFKILFIFRDEGERQGNINVWLPLTCPTLGSRPTIQACALTGN